MIKKILIYGTLIGSLLVHTACNDSSFSGASKLRPSRMSSSGNSGSAGSVWRAVNSTAIQKIWAVTSNGNAFYMELEGDTVKVTKRWSGISGTGGTRTYVTEGGLIAARFPYVYFIDPAGTPEGTIPAENKKITSAGPSATERICLTSYRKDGQRYMLGAWGNGNWFEYKLEDTPPYRPQWNDPAATRTGTINPPRNDTTAIQDGNINPRQQWGYNCFIDQQRMIFYSAWHSSTAVGALHLNSLGTAEASIAPNYNFSSNNISVLTKSTKGPTSYAMAGDANGNVINSQGVYTAAHDTKSDTIWISLHHGLTNSANQIKSLIGLFPSACFSSNPDCAGFAWYQPTYNGINIQVGPLSALKDGRIVGVTRGTGEVYVLSLVDPSDRTKGMTAVKIADLGGDPYMYTDFTGATLYVTDYLEEVDLTEAPFFNPKQPIKEVRYKWFPKAGKSTTWQAMKLEVRCYQDGGQKPDFSEVLFPGEAGIYHSGKIPSCDNKVANRAEVRVSQLNNETTLVDLERIELGIDQ